MCGAELPNAATNEKAPACSGDYSVPVRRQQIGYRLRLDASFV